MLGTDGEVFAATVCTCFIFFFCSFLNCDLWYLPNISLIYLVVLSQLGNECDHMCSPPPPSTPRHVHNLKGVSAKVQTRPLAPTHKQLFVAPQHVVHSAACALLKKKRKKAQSDTLFLSFVPSFSPCAIFVVLFLVKWSSHAAGCRLGVNLLQKKERVGHSFFLFFFIYRRGLPWLYNEPGGYVAEMWSAPVTSYMMQWWRWEGVNRDEQLYSAMISPNRLSSSSQSLPGPGFPTAITVEMSSSTTHTHTQKT